MNRNVKNVCMAKLTVLGRPLAQPRWGCLGYVLFENMGLIIRPNVHRNSEGGVGRGTENVIKDRLRRD